MHSQKVTFFTQLYFPDMTTTSLIMTDLAEDLSQYGMDVRVVAAQPTYLGKTRAPKKETVRGVAIQRVATFTFNKNNNLGRILNGCSCLARMFLAIFTIPKTHLLVVNTNPAMMPLLGYFAACIRGNRYVVLIHDLWPELPANIGMIKKHGLLFKIIDNILGLAYRKAAGIVVLSEAMREAIQKKIPDQAERVHVIHNWADHNRVYPEAKGNNRLRHELGAQDKKIVMYSGNLGRYQPLEVMLDAAAVLRNRSDILFVFAGSGAKEQSLRQRAAQHNLDNVRFIPFQPLERLAESLSMADISLLGIAPENEGVIMPSKLYGLLAIAKPIVTISHKDSEVVTMLEQAGAGLHGTENDPAELAQKIEKLFDAPEAAKLMGEKGKKYFLENFERKVVTRQWYQLLTEIDI